MGLDSVEPAADLLHVVGHQRIGDVGVGAVGQRRQIDHGRVDLRRGNSPGVIVRSRAAVQALASVRALSSSAALISMAAWSSAARATLNSDAWSTVSRTDARVCE